MGPIKEKLAAWSKDRALVRCGAAVGAALILLIIITCISIHMRSNIQDEYSSLISQMKAQTYASLSQMVEIFSNVDNPETDVRNGLIPELKTQYAAAKAMNAALGEHAVLDAGQIAAFDAAFDQYSRAYKQGSATGLAKADMHECIHEVQLLVEEYYSPADERNNVVVIDASSGRVAKD